MVLALFLIAIVVVVCVFQNVYIFLHIAQWAKMWIVTKAYLVWSKRGHKKILWPLFEKVYNLRISLQLRYSKKVFLWMSERRHCLFPVAHVSSVAKPGSDQRKKIHFTLTYITRQCTMYLGLLPYKTIKRFFLSPDSKYNTTLVGSAYGIFNISPKLLKPSQN